MAFKLSPVILKVPKEIRVSDPKERVILLSQLARKALLISADRSGLTLKHLKKGKKGEPLPEKGVYWSLAHKETWVGAVVAMQPVGIDLERVKPVRNGLFAKVATQEDWAMVGGTNETTFYRLWTAKEAVVKAEGVGFAGFSRCRVAEPPATDQLKITYEQRVYPITFKQLNGHIIAITSEPDTVEWQIIS